jgi:hypothetical protein
MSSNELLVHLAHMHEPAAAESHIAQRCSQPISARPYLRMNCSHVFGQCVGLRMRMRAPMLTLHKDAAAHY